jgi:hypothetical protein
MNVLNNSHDHIIFAHAQWIWALNGSTADG